MKATQNHTIARRPVNWLTISVEDAAVVLGVSRTTAYELVRAGELEHLRIGRSIRVPAQPLADRLGVSLEVLHSAIDA